MEDYPESLIIKNSFTVSNFIDGKSRWCTCGEALTIPIGFKLENCKFVDGRTSDKYMGYIYCNKEGILQRLRNGRVFKKGFGAHTIVGDYEGLKDK